MDEISLLEQLIEKLSLKFYDSLSNIQKLAPLVNYPNEENMENSQENKNRMEFEQIQNYEENKENYQRIIEESAQEIGNCFDNLFLTLNTLTEKEGVSDVNATKIEMEIKNMKNEMSSNALFGFRKCLSILG